MQFCSLLPNNMPPEDIMWVQQMGLNISTIMSTWDMKANSLVQNYNQVTKFITYMIQLDLYCGSVIFGYDENFPSKSQSPCTHVEFYFGVVHWMQAVVVAVVVVVVVVASSLLLGSFGASSSFGMFVEYSMY